ncbi:MAG TPA: IPT/TIG domain-containing protein, partial [Candidatus Sulfotelmatobacter sp.]|nr:IPT/TIG domain-containing protein [Candidatus Sulfotelmatobacter sp.]
FLSVDGGLIVAAHAADDSMLNIDSATANSAKLDTSSDNLAYTDMISAGAISLAVTSGMTDISATVNLPAGGTEPYLVKPGPAIARVFSAAAANFPLELAPRELISIYGTDLASGPTTVLANGASITTDYVSATQINAVLPPTLSGIVQLTVLNADGQSSVNLLMGAAAPAVFTQDSSGSGAASALKASDQSLVTSANPLSVGDTVELFVTGLGVTSSSNGMEVAVQQPMVTVGGVNCPVTFAGAAPGFTGLDQINCTIPSGMLISDPANNSVPVVIASDSRISNTATLAIASD